MLKLEVTQYELLKSVFQVEPGLQTASFLIDNRMGEAYVDSMEGPGWGLIRYAEDMILSGVKAVDELPRLLKEMNFKGLLEIHPVFADIVVEVYSEAQEWERISFIADSIPEIPTQLGASVRPLRPDDAPGLLNIGERWLWKFAGSPEGLIESFPTAGSFVRKRLAAFCSVFTRSSLYDDLAVVTSPKFRGMGLGTMCAAFLTGELMNRGRIPVWNTSTDNIDAGRIAVRLETGKG